MTLEEALKNFNSGYHLCQKLGVKPSNYSKWKAQNWIPLKQQFMINEILDKKLPIDPTKEAMESRISRKEL